MGLDTVLDTGSDMGLDTGSDTGSDMGLDTGLDTGWIGFGYGSIVDTSIGIRVWIRVRDMGLDTGSDTGREMDSVKIPAPLPRIQHRDDDNSAGCQGQSPAGSYRAPGQGRRITEGPFSLLCSAPVSAPKPRENIFKREKIHRRSGDRKPEQPCWLSGKKRLVSVAAGRRAFVNDVFGVAMGGKRGKAGGHAESGTFA